MESYNYREGTVKVTLANLLFHREEHCWPLLNDLPKVTHSGVGLFLPG